jgi:hypothetical protein
MFTKLGKDWKLHINLGVWFTVVTDEKEQGLIFDRVGRKVVALAAELENMDSDLVDAINDRCKNKQLIIAFGGTSDDYPKIYRYGVVFDDAITITFATEYKMWGENYPFGEKATLTALALNHF